MPARIIFKAHYLSGEKSKHIENYIQYMGTRPGVEIFEDDGSPVTEKQEQLIAQLIEDFGKEMTDTFEYEDYLAKPTKQTYGNGDYIDFTYDNLDRVTEKKYNGSSTNRAVYRYGNDGSLSQTVDFLTGTRTKFTYDLADRLVSQKEYTGTGNNGGSLLSSTDFTYADKTNYLTGVKHFSPLGTQNIGYTYGDINQGQMPDQIYKVSWNGQEKLNFVYDPLGRLTSKQILVGGGDHDAPNTLSTQYTYVDVGTDKTTTLVQSLQTPVGTYNYTYDAVGNITGISLDGGCTNTYVYDTLNQLVRENNQESGKTYTYTYVNGNITERKEYAYTTGELGEVLDTKTWSYTDNTWSDLLTNFNGKSISYDEIGNPTTIGNQLLSWNGRQLQGITDSENTYTYLYNTDGQRVSKIVNGVTTEYFYNGSILAGQKTGNDTLVFMYDNNGDIFGFTYDGLTFYYVKNAQNDVVGLALGEDVVAYYFYDAWGNARIINDAGYPIYDQGHPAYINPIRYRSYYYDNESNLYYLNSRYYSPEMCRFLNADGAIGANQDIHAYNLFAYCSNNPVNFCDPTGESILGALGATLGALAPWFIAVVAIAIVGTIAITVVGTPAINDGVATGIGNAIGAINNAIDNVKERVKEKTRAKEATTAIPRDKKPKEPVVFPVNPYDFHPLGLEMQVRVDIGNGKNGGIIHWTLPNTNIAIFEWDEDYLCGPHYHVMLPSWKGEHISDKHGYKHEYKAGDNVPEPWKSIYFK